MRFVDEFRDPAAAARLAAAIARACTRPHTIMEVCGGQTHAIVRFGLDAMLPPGLELIHGPGCPVCVTPAGAIDRAIAIAGRGAVLCTFGDMMRVPGTGSDLIAAKSAGADVRMVYAPLDAVRMAQEQPAREIVFFAVGFETTAPSSALAVRRAHALGLRNFSILSAHVRVPPALEALMAAPDCRIEGFLAAGHVCTIMGCGEYAPIAARHRVPIAVTGFEPIDILRGVLDCVTQLEAGRAEVTNMYPRAVRLEGNPAAIALLGEVFEPVARRWRGLGEIPESGLGLRPAYAAFDAGCRFGLDDAAPEPASECIAGLVLQGLKRPHECPAFGTRCTPEQPLGAPMVSSEGACAAYHRYRPAAAAAR